MAFGTLCEHSSNRPQPIYPQKSLFTNKCLQCSKVSYRTKTSSLLIVSPDSTPFPPTHRSRKVFTLQHPHDHHSPSYRRYDHGCPCCPKIDRPAASTILHQQTKRSTTSQPSPPKPKTRLQSGTTARSTIQRPRTQVAKKGNLPPPYSTTYTLQAVPTKQKSPPRYSNS